MSNDEAPGLNATLPGGATRVTIGGGAPEADVTERTSLSNEPGGMSFDVGSGETTRNQTFSVSASEMRNHGAGIMETARSKSGTVPAELTPDCLVTVTHGRHGLEMTLRDAERHGFVKRGADGRYFDPAAPQAAPQSVEQAQAQALRQAQAQASANPAMTQDAFPEAFEAALQHVAGNTSQDVLRPVVTRLAIEFANTGEVQPNIERVVSETGMEYEQAKAYVSMVENAMRSQASDELAKLGIVGQEFVEWCREHRSEKFTAAVVRQASARSLDGYRELAEDYLRYFPPSEEALRAAGREVQRDRLTGQLMVKLDGGYWTPIKVAARMGRI